jgi:hypothetical protein
VTPAGDLSVFYEIPDSHNWMTVNVSQRTSVRLDGPLTCWVRGSYPNQEDNVAGATFDGDFVVFSWTAAGNWTAANLTQQTGQKVAKRVTPVFWLSGTGTAPVENIAAAAPNGDVLVFWRASPGAWSVTNVSTVDGQKVDLNTGFTAWQTPLGADLVEHLAAPNAAGDLIVHWWKPGYGWNAENLSSKTGFKVWSAPTAWQTPTLPTHVEYLAAVSAGGDLIVFWFTPANDWQWLNVSQMTGKKARGGGPESWKTYIGTSSSAVDHVGTVGPSGGLLVFYTEQDLNNWQVTDVSALTGVQAEGPFTSWRTGYAPDVVEHVAAFGPD